MVSLLHVFLTNETILASISTDFHLKMVKINIPCKMFYSSIAAECLRVCRATSTSDHATTSIKAVIVRMTKQGADMAKMKSCITKMCNRHNIVMKYGIHGRTFNKQLFTF